MLAGFSNAVAVLTAGALLTFAVEAGTRPSWGGVVPLLAGIFVLSAAYSIYAWWKKRETSKSSGRTGIRGRRSTIRSKGGKIAGQDTAVDLDDSDYESEDTDIE